MPPNIHNATETVLSDETLGATSLSSEIEGFIRNKKTHEHKIQKLRAWAGLTGKDATTAKIAKALHLSREALRLHTVELRKRWALKPTPLLKKCRDFIQQHEIVTLDVLEEHLEQLLGIQPQGLANVLGYHFHPILETLSTKQVRRLEKGIHLQERNLTRIPGLSHNEKVALLNEKAHVYRDPQGCWLISHFWVKSIAHSALKVLAVHEQQQVGHAELTRQLKKLTVLRDGKRQHLIRDEHHLRAILTIAIRYHPLNWNEEIQGWIATETLDPEEYLTKNETEVYKLLKAGPSYLGALGYFLKRRTAQMYVRCHHLTFVETQKPQLIRLIGDSRPFPNTTLQPLRFPMIPSTKIRIPKWGHPNFKQYTTDGVACLCSAKHLPDNIHVQLKDGNVVTLKKDQGRYAPKAKRFEAHNGQFFGVIDIAATQIPANHTEAAACSQAERQFCAVAKKVYEEIPQLKDEKGNLITNTRTVERPILIKALTQRISGLMKDEKCAKTGKEREAINYLIAIESARLQRTTETNPLGLDLSHIQSNPGKERARAPKRGELTQVSSNANKSNPTKITTRANAQMVLYSISLTRHGRVTPEAAELKAAFLAENPHVTEGSWAAYVANITRAAGFRERIPTLEEEAFKNLKSPNNGESNASLHIEEITEHNEKRVLHHMRVVANENPNCGWLAREQKRKTGTFQGNDETLNKLGLPEFQTAQCDFLTLGAANFADLENLMAYGHTYRNVFSAERDPAVAKQAQAKARILNAEHPGMKVHVHHGDVVELFDPKNKTLKGARLSRIYLDTCNNPNQELFKLIEAVGKELPRLAEPMHILGKPLKFDLTICRGRQRDYPEVLKTLQAALTPDETRILKKLREENLAGTHPTKYQVECYTHFLTDTLGLSAMLKKELAQSECWAKPTTIIRYKDSAMPMVFMSWEILPTEGLPKELAYRTALNDIAIDSHGYKDDAYEAGAPKTIEDLILEAQAAHSHTDVELLNKLAPQFTSLSLDGLKKILAQMVEEGRLT